jgi:hypothetical protein
MDHIGSVHPPGDFGEIRGWRSAGRAVAVLLKRLRGAIRDISLQKLFYEGRSLGWLTSILRGEIFAHGAHGDSPQPEERWLVTGEEFAKILPMMIGRYRHTPPDELMRVPELLSLLYAWKQGSGTDEPRAWAEKQTATDAGLLALLPHMRGWAAASGEGVYYPLKRRDLETFLDVDDAIMRLEAIVASQTASVTDKQLASELLDAFNSDK